MSSLTIEEIEDLYSRYGLNVLCRCQQLLRDETAAWDAMHQTYVRVIKYRQSFKRDAKPLTWLFSIATRVCLDEIRARSRGEPLECTDVPWTEEPTAPITIEERLHQQQTVRRLLYFFNAAVQEIVVLRYFYDLEVREISAQTGLSERTIARRLNQFLERSRRLLAESRSLAGSTEIDKT